MRIQLQKTLFLELVDGKLWRLTDDWLTDYLTIYDDSGKFGCDGRFHLTIHLIDTIKSIVSCSHHAMFTNSIDKRFMPCKVTSLPRTGQTLSGYGKAIPTQYMVFYNKRWKRVYCSIFSNSGTLYINKRLFLTLTLYDGV